MSTFTVNTIPGNGTNTISPNQPIQMGIRSDSRTIQPATIFSDVAYSGFRNLGANPLTDPNLLATGCLTTYQSVERFRPQTTSSPISFNGTNLVITKDSASDQGDNCVMEISSPLDTNTSVVGYLKFKRASWSNASYNWNSGYSNCAPIYMAVEYGPANTMAMVGLTSTSITLGGPLQAFGTARPGTISTALSWAALAVGQILEIWIVFNQYAQTAEVWTSLNGAQTVVSLSSPIISLGHYPTTQTSTSGPTRNGLSNSCTLLFGVPGTTGDTLEVVDWTLYPDYRKSIISGQFTTNIIGNIVPDLPITFNASDNLTLPKSNPSVWFPTSSSVIPSLQYNPGTVSTAISSSISKNTSGVGFYNRTEPRLLSLQSGSMIEGLISASVLGRQNDTTGMGFGIDDGTGLYSAIFVNNAAGRSTVGILGSTLGQDVFTNYYTSSNDYDYSSFRLVRLVLDRVRSKVSVFVENQDTPIVVSPLGSAFPPSFIPGNVLAGHILNTSATGSLNIHSLNYWNSYKAWEGVDGVLPSGALDPRIVFNQLITPGSFASIVSSSVKLTGSIGGTSSFRRYEPFNINSGVVVDFNVSIPTYTDSNSTLYAKNTRLSNALNIYFGTKKLQLGFYDCGIYGRKLGIIPGSGSDQDIINQTTLGRAFSGSYDWTKATAYRVSATSFKGIQVWAGSIKNTPIITIPWTDIYSNYDLPLDSTASSFEFGQTDTRGSTTSIWSYIRWGTSSGYDLSIEPAFPNGYKTYLFNANILSSITFTEN